MEYNEEPPFRGGDLIEWRPHKANLYSSWTVLANPADSMITILPDQHCVMLVLEVTASGEAFYEAVKQINSDTSTTVVYLKQRALYHVVTSYDSKVLRRSGKHSDWKDWRVIAKGVADDK